MDGVCMHHSAHERAIGRADERLDKHGAELDQLRDCVTRLTALQEADAAWRADAERRLDALEAVPVQRWEKAVTVAITGVVGAAVGMALAAAGMG